MRAFGSSLLFVIIWNISLSAQVQNQIWYFGEYCGLNFDEDPPTVLLDNATNSGWACGSICKLNGELQFYASGHEMRNDQHGLMINGSGFAYVDSEPGPLIVPWPNDPDHFLSIGWKASFNPAVRTYYYQVVDIASNGGAGEVVLKDVVLQDSVSSGVVAVPHCNEQDYWIIVHEKYSDRFLSFLLDSTGIVLNPVQSSVGRSHAYWIWERDVLQASPNGDRLAYSYRAANGWNLDIFNVDPCTGSVSTAMPIGSGERFLMPEFAPSGDLLYAVANSCTPGDSSRLWQYDLNAGDSTQIRASRALLHAEPYHPVCGKGMFHMALAPNGKVYVAIMDTTCLGVINMPDLQGPAADFVYCGQDLGGRRNYGNVPHQVKFPPSPNAVPESSVHPEPLRIHPTPASDGFWLDTDLATHLELLDLQGRTVQRTRFPGTGPYWVSREGLGAGTYVLRAFSEHGEVIGQGRVVFR